MNEIERLIKYQEKTGKSQAQLAKEIGVSVFTIHRWFNNKFHASRLSQRAISNYLQEMTRKESKGGSHENIA